MEASRNNKQFLHMHQVELYEWAPPVSVVFLIIFTFLIAMINYRMGFMYDSYLGTRDSIASAMQSVAPVVEKVNSEDSFVDRNSYVDVDYSDAVIVEGEFGNALSHQITMPPAQKTAAMTEVFTMNEDTAGWLKIDGMVIDYPVMQTMDDEQYYLNRDFNGKYSAYGCILADTDSIIGTGTAINEYADGTKPSTNIILHGHNMKNGSMFGSLDKFRDQAFERQHSIIKFSSLYEDREYEICSVFLSQVYKKSDDVFKYYKFFNAYNEEEFNDFYNNIKSLALYDTGVEASFGDEFITLSVCAYHVDNGRLVVVGKRIK